MHVLKYQVVIKTQSLLFYPVMSSALPYTETKYRSDIITQSVTINMIDKA